MFQLLTEDVVREQYHERLADAEADRRAAQQVELKRAWRRMERARANLDRILEETLALPARPNPLTADEPGREKQLA